MPQSASDPPSKPPSGKSGAFPFPTSEHHASSPEQPVRPVVTEPSEEAIDNGVAESFPASDPVSVTVTKAVPTAGKETGARKR